MYGRGSRLGHVTYIILQHFHFPLSKDFVHLQWGIAFILIDLLHSRAVNKDKHIRSNEFEFQPDRTTTELPTLEGLETHGRCEHGSAFILIAYSVFLQETRTSI